MERSVVGGCQCGSVRYRVDAEPLELYVCHCRDCQRQTGSAFGMSMIIAVSSFQLLSGELASFGVRCDSGRLKRCSFCPACGTRIHHQIRAEMLSVKAGTLDDTSWLRPEAHIWTKRKQPWVVIPEGARCVEDDG